MMDRNTAGRVPERGGESRACPPEVRESQEKLRLEIQELGQRIAAQRMAAQTTRGKVLDEAYKSLCKLGFRPEEVRRRVSQALGRTTFTRAEDLVLAALKEV